MESVTLNILRNNRRMGRTWQKIVLDAARFADGAHTATVATALRLINETDARDADGEVVAPVQWECGCLQRKCGACAMVINDRPALACAVRLRDCKGGTATVEPLRKFPVVEDLVVDRSAMYENLKRFRMWLDDAAETPERDRTLAYDGARCLQCGCCLEVCPNFYAGGDFFGTAAAVPAARLTAYGDVSERYEKHVYAGCGKSLACRSVCPAGIDIDRLLVKTNARAVWKK